MGVELTLKQEVRLWFSDRASDLASIFNRKTPPVDVIFYATGKDISEVLTVEDKVIAKDALLAHGYDNPNDHIELYESFMVFFDGGMDIKHES